MIGIDAYIGYGAFAAYAALFIGAAASDIWRYKIPNWIVVALTAVFFATAFALLYVASPLALPFGIDWLGHLGAAALVLALGILLYGFGLLGAGDGKLLAVGALWAGWDLLVHYALYVALIGGGFAISVMVLRRVKNGVAYYAPVISRVHWPRMFYGGEGIPYGIAISAGALVLGPSLPFFEMLW